MPAVHPLQRQRRMPCRRGATANNTPRAAPAPPGGPPASDGVFAAVRPRQVPTVDALEREGRGAARSSLVEAEARPVATHDTLHIERRLVRTQHRAEPAVGKAADVPVVYALHLHRSVLLRQALPEARPLQMPAVCGLEA